MMWNFGLLNQRGVHRAMQTRKWSMAAFIFVCIATKKNKDSQRTEL